MSLILIVLVILLLCGGFTSLPGGFGWNRGASYGYGPSGIFGVLLLVLIVLAILRLLPF